MAVTVARSAALRLTWEDDRRTLIAINTQNGRVFRLNKPAGEILERLPIQFDTALGHQQQTFIQNLIDSGLAERI